MKGATSIEVARQTLFYCGLVLCAGTLTALLARKVRIPDVALLLVVGMILGPTVLGVINIRADSALNQIILLFGASYILFDGGASLRLAVLKQTWVTIAMLATVGILVTGTITALAAHLVLGVPLVVALLLGATISPTDPATLVPIFRQVKIRDRVAQTVIGESAFNDAMGAILTFGLLAAATGSGGFSLTASVVDLFRQSIVGIVAGVAVGYVAAVMIAHERWAFLAEYSPVVTLLAVIGAYLAADALQASGLMAVFVCGIVLGNKDSLGFHMDAREARKLDEYVATIAFIMRLFIFISLGSQVDFRLVGQYLGGGIAVAAVFMLVARPLTVFVCAGADRPANWSLSELLFMSWTRQTGAIPGTLATLLVAMKAPGAQVIAAVTFIAILMTILIQVPTARWLAARLGLLEDSPSFGA